MNDTRGERPRERARRHDPSLRWAFWTGFAISFVACWVGYELGQRSCRS